MGKDEKEKDLLLVERSKNGDKKAFEELVLKHQDRVYNLCRYMLGSPSDAEDAAQEVFIKAYRNIEGFSPTAGFAAWLSRIAINSCIDYKRRPAHWSLLRTTSEGEEYAVEEESALPGPESSLESKESGQAIEKALAALSEKLRAVIVLREIEGLSYEEIAAALDISVGTVKSRIARAREELQRLLKD